MQYADKLWPRETAAAGGEAEGDGSGGGSGAGGPVDGSKGASFSDELAAEIAAEKSKTGKSSHRFSKVDMGQVGSPHCTSRLPQHKLHYIETSLLTLFRIDRIRGDWCCFLLSTSRWTP